MTHVDRVPTEVPDEQLVRQLGEHAPCHLREAEAWRRALDEIDARWQAERWLGVWAWLALVGWSILGIQVIRWWLAS